MDVIFPIGSDAEAVYNVFYVRFSDGTVKYRQYPEAVIEACKRVRMAHHKSRGTDFGAERFINNQLLTELATKTAKEVFPINFLEAHPEFHSFPHPTIFWQFKDGSGMKMSQFFCDRL
jgi:hypothetical protein